MKKLLIALMLVPALLLVSCNPANKKAAETEKKTTADAAKKE